MNKRHGKRGGKRKRCISETELDELWKEVFSRIYFLPIKKEEEKLASNGELETLFEFLKTKKKELNNTKSELNSIDIVKWRQHTSNMHVCGLIPSYLRREIKAELVTQAWTKFYTILSSFSLIQSDNTENLFKSIHLCEAPGAFITSLNHFINSRYRRDFLWNWVATTLNPYYEGNTLNEMVADDRLIIETFSNWDFSNDFSGNIMNFDNFESFTKKYKNINLVTADGSVDCSEDPGAQEILVMPLVLWEIVYAFNILADSGCLVLKIFTTFEKSTIELLYLLWVFFRKVSLIKPGPSKPGNSEVYVVCQYFMKEQCFNEEIFTALIRSLKKGNIVLPDCLHRIPKSFVIFLRKYVETSCEKQIQAINKNLESFYSGEKLGDMKDCREYISHRFIDEFQITKIKDYVAPMLSLKGHHSHYDKREDISYKHGSLDERSANSDKSLLKHIKKSNPEKMCGNIYFRKQDSFNIKTIGKQGFIIGKRVENINSSSFCSSIFLTQYQKLKTKPKRKFSLVDSGAEFLKIVDTSNDVLLVVGFIGTEKDFMEIQSKSSSVATVVHLTSQTEIAVDAKYFCLLCTMNLYATKIKNLNELCSCLKFITFSNQFVLIFDSLILTNFWCGLVFLLSSLFEEMEYHYFSGSVTIVFHNTTKSSALVEPFQKMVRDAMDILSELSSDKDLLTTAPLYSLMHSEFRNYIKYRNHSIIKSMMPLEHSTNSCEELPD